MHVSHIFAKYILDLLHRNKGFSLGVVYISIYIWIFEASSSHPGPQCHMEKA